jgi:hypothetical protein
MKYKIIFEPSIYSIEVEADNKGDAQEIAYDLIEDSPSRFTLIVNEIVEVKEAK